MVSGVVICQNEQAIIQTCLEQLHWVNEIIVVDGMSTDNTVDKIQEFKDKSSYGSNIRLFRAPFTGHFGDQKNLGISKVRNPWTFVLDADETIEEGLPEELKQMAESRKFDSVNIPRKNYIAQVITEVYPDYQARFFRSYCRYIYAQHEELVGTRKVGVSKNHILHYKSIRRNDRQQDYYRENVSLNKIFLRMPNEE